MSDAAKGASSPTPLDAERERLRKAGYTEAEVSQILIARQASQQGGSAGHGVMSGVASNLAAAAGYIGNFVPSIFENIATMRSKSASTPARSQAAGYLVMKAIVVCVVAYILLLEFRQFQSATDRADAEACNARRKLLLDTMPYISPDNRNAMDSPTYRNWRRKHDEFDRDCIGASDKR